ncbi:MAG: amino acid adenylation domain-containing protein, partial [Bacillota bacterium]|nr:amino acid adenylation domain-containing protein [Bacillota bacterium]
DYIAPANDLEKQICEGFDSILKCGRVGSADDFFMLGGDSIKTIKLVSELNLEGLTREMILLGKTPAGIAKEYEKRTNSIEHKNTLLKEYPLTASQLGVYLECLEKPESTMYNIPLYALLPKDIDVDKFEAAVKKVAALHPVLNAKFNVSDGKTVMQVEQKDILVSRKDIASFDDECSNFVKAFDLENGPLYRFQIWNDGFRNYFVYDIHHIVFDGTSIEVLLNQIVDCYLGEELEEEKLNIFDIALHEINLKDSDEYKAADKFFNEKFGSIDADSIPIADVISEAQEKGSGRVDFTAESNLTVSEVESFVRKHGITENTLFLSAFAYCLAKFNGLNNSLFCTVNNGRHDDRLSNSIGMFVRTFPMYFDIDDNALVDEFLHQTQDYFFNTMSHDCIDMSELVHKYGFNTTVQFVYQAEMLSGVEKGGIKLLNRTIKNNDLAGDMQLMIHKLDSTYEAVLNFNGNSYSDLLMNSFVNMYFQIVSEMLKADKLSEIELVNRDARILIDKFNETDAYYDKEATVVELFKEQVKQNPDAECVVYEDKKYTYKQVDELSDKLAKHLVCCGVKAETVTGILIPRSEYMVIASLGVLKAGGAYMPLDPSYPPERLNLMMQDAEAMMLITTQSLSSIINDEYQGERMMVSDIEGLTDEADLSLISIKPNDRFVMLYTSGTTGKPKGVIYEHANVMCLAAWMRDFFEYDLNTKRAVYASYGFDANVFDTYGVLTAGGSLHIISEDIRLDLLALQKYFNENKITDCVMTTQVGRQFALMPGTTSLKELSAAGEALTPLEPVNDFKFYNLYGPSEGTVLVTQFLVDRKYKNIPIGRAIDNVKLYIVDNQKKLLPMGATGELIIAGPHVTRGYLNRPEKTAESYSSNCYSNEKGYERLYHTGDIVRLLPDGNIQFVGRRDMQVKIRGFRIELTEVEEVIRRYAGIKDATVAAFDSENGGKFLAAYIVADEKIDDKKVKEFIKAEKPAYMVPAVIMQIDQIPLNQNQKVNKKALPVPAYKAEDFVAAQNEMQQKIFDIVSDAIGHKNFGIDTDFFEAGLTSIGAVKLNYDLAECFGVPVKTSDINANSTVRRLESFFNSNNKIEEYEIRFEYPISQTQQGIFVESFGSPNSTVYNIPVMLKINSNVDLNELKDAIIKASNAHPYIKTKLHMDENGDVKALRNDDVEVKIECTNIDNDPVIADYVKPFSMLDSELYRFNIIHSEGGNYLFMDLHHIISDGTSELILLSDIRKALRKESLSTETYTAYELALDEEKLRKTSKYDDAKAYYDNLLAGCDTESLPPKILDAKDKGSAELSKVFELDTQVVSKYCKDNGITENAFFNAVFSVLLANFTHKEQALYVTIHNGRNDTRLKDSIAMLVKTIPVLANIDGSKAPKDLALELQKQLAKSMSNDLFAFAEIANAYDVKSDVMFVYQGADFGMDVLNSDIMEFSQGYSADAKAPITFEISITGGKYLAKLDYKTEIYNAEFAESFVSSFETAAANFMSAVSIKDISILSAEGKAFVDKVNDTDTEFENIPLCKLFEKVAAANEDKLAMVSNGETVTFKELNERANKIANSLIKLGVKSEDIIGLIVNRSVNVIAAELGIMKTGAAFLPMLPDYPEDRIKYCLSDSESKLVITTDAIKAEHSEYFADSLSYKTKTLEELLKENNAKNPNIEIPMDSMAYCIYTSGSTGNPKGVMIEHHNLTNFVQTYDGDIWLLRYEKVNGAALGMSSVSFDMSIAEIYPPLCSGMCFVMATEYEIHNPDALAKLIENNNVSCIVCTPTFIINMIDIPEFSKAFGNIKSLLSAAESLPASLIDKLQIYSPDIRIVNGYGPTETTVGCSAKIVDNAGKITIGGPSGNVKLYAIDRFGNILPPYASGELIICGEGVSRGYIKLSEKNKASFYTLNGLPAYHSGDIVRMDKNGEFEFFGRSDNQVKLRGFRVELDEIEKAFCSFTGVKQSKVIVRNNGKEDYLAAFFTADHQIDLGNLRTHLKSILTYYMVPAAIMQLDQMPLTTNGKIDKKALPEISISKKHRSSKRTAKKTTEQELCDLFKQILALDEYYPDDDFFEMGGTSISASKVTMMLMSKGIEIQYQDVFDNPTPESLAELIDGKSPKTDASEQKEDSFASEYDSVLKYNSLAYAAEVSRKPLGNVFLAGATGFLGIHVLAELLQSEEGHIYCLVRKGKYNSPEERLKKLLVYYFDDISDEIFERRIKIIDDDITNDNICDVVKDIKIDTIINCAAIVKHYAVDDSLYRVNVHGVENLIDVAKEHDAKLIQISTTSIPGSHTDETYKINLKMYENQHFVIDDMDNKYISSKYQAECRIFSAIKEGLHAKVIRVGNLMGRFSDGEFQMNMTTNAFLNALRGFVTLGKCPIGHSTDPM